jgi:hypothetical protein
MDHHKKQKAPPIGGAAQVRVVVERWMVSSYTRSPADPFAER